VAGDESLPEGLRAEATVGLTGEATTQRELLLKLAIGSSRILREEALRSLRGTKLSADELRRLETVNKPGAPEGELVARLAATEPGPLSANSKDPEHWLALLDGTGDAVAGERIFFHAQAAGCNRCHQAEGRGARIGPDLTYTPATLDRRRLVESIVLPSKEIAPQFVAWSIVKTDGTVFTGVLVGESVTGEQTYADAKGNYVVVKPAEIDEREPQKISIMPEGLLDRLTAQELRDLFAYLARKK
jgi:putative heme-binding domain-containing protein